MKNKLSYIPQQWMSTKGRNVNIGICDTGFDLNNIDLKEHITQYKDFGNSNTKHGTHVLGIMCLNSSSNIAIKGMASLSKYYLASSLIGQTEHQRASLQTVKKALQWLSTCNLDVLNLSFTYLNNNKQIFQILKQMNDNGTIIVSAYAQQYNFPHSYDFVISAGQDIICDDSYFSSLPNNQIGSLRGTSMQTAFISSVVACAKSFDKKIDKSTFLDAVLGEHMLTSKYMKQRKQYNIIL